MTGTRSRIFARLALTVGIISILGCGRRSVEERRSGVAADSARASLNRQSPEGVPSSNFEPTGPPIGRSDTLVNAARPQLAEWEALWSAAMPGFALDSLWLVGQRRWRPIQQRPFVRRRQTSKDVSFEVLGLRSPDESRTLLIDHYLVVEPEGDSLSVGGEPESEPSLIDHRAIVESLFALCGTPCRYSWGTWLAADRFALGGFSDSDTRGRLHHGSLWIYSISDSSVSEYGTRSFSREEYDRYLASWNAWLLRRYRARLGQRG